MGGVVPRWAAAGVATPAIWLLVCLIAGLTGHNMGAGLSQDNGESPRGSRVVGVSYTSKLGTPPPLLNPLILSPSSAVC